MPTREEMYRSHLVPLPFHLLGLCLKVVQLLLPTGSSTREVPSVHDKVVCNEFEDKPEKNRVQVKQR